MNKVIYLSLIFLLLFAGACGNNSSRLNRQNEGGDSTLKESASEILTGEGPILTFDKSLHDFGKLRIRKNPKVEFDFEFTNTGNEPLMIIKVDVSCSCLTADYPKMAIPPGSNGKITVTIDTKDQKGNFNKPVFVKSNALNDVELIRIKGILK